MFRIAMYAALEQELSDRGMRMTISHFDCGERITVYRESHCIVSVARDCADEDGPLPVVVSFLTDNGFLAEGNDSATPDPSKRPSTR
jgi:hypothetical protein